MVESTKEPSVDLINKCLRYLRACGELAAKNNRSDAWKWWYKASQISKKLPSTENPVKVLGMYGTSTFMQELIIPEGEVGNIDIRVLCGISGTHSPFGSK